MIFLSLMIPTGCGFPPPDGPDDESRRRALWRNDGFLGGAGTYGLDAGCFFSGSFFSGSFTPGEYAAPKGFGNSTFGLSAFVTVASFAGDGAGELEENFELRLEKKEFRLCPDFWPWSFFPGIAVLFAWPSLLIPRLRPCSRGGVCVFEASVTLGGWEFSVVMAVGDSSVFDVDSGTPLAAPFVCGCSSSVGAADMSAFELTGGTASPLTCEGGEIREA